MGFILREIVSEEEGNTMKKGSKIKTSQSVLNHSSSRVKNYNEPLLEIRNVREDRQSPKSEDDHLSKSLHHDHKSALDYMPKYVLRQINEKRMLNATTIGNPSSSMNGSSYSTAMTTIMTPYNLYNSKNQNEMIENAARDLNRRSVKSSKIQSQLVQNNQQKLLHHSSSSSSLHQQNQSKTNNGQSTPTNNGQVTLFSSAFVTMNHPNAQMKSQYDKMITRAGMSASIQAANSALSTTSTTMVANYTNRYKNSK